MDPVKPACIAISSPSAALDGSGVDGDENDYVDSNDVVGVHVRGDHRQVPS